MRHFLSFFTAILGAALPAALRAQDDPAGPDTGEEALRRRILRRVEKEIEEDDARIRRDIERILDAELRPAWLGISVVPLPPEERKSLFVDPDEGVRVAGVVPGSPAEGAGLAPGDVILHVGRSRVGDAAALRRAMALMRPGDMALLTYLREGEPRRVKVALGAAPGTADAAGPRDARRREALRGRLRELLEDGAGAGSASVAAPSGASPAPPDFDPETLIEDLFDGPPDRGNPLQQYFQSLHSVPGGDALLEFLRGEMSRFAPSLRVLAERGKDGRWRLRKDSAEFLRAWLEDEVARGGKPSTAGGAPPEAGRAQPQTPASAAPRFRLGIHVDDLDAAARAGAGLPEGAGFRVVRVTPGSPAEAAGLRPGDVVVKIGGEAASEKQLKSVLDRARPGDRLLLTVRRGAQDQALDVTLGD